MLLKTGLSVSTDNLWGRYMQYIFAYRNFIMGNLVLYNLAWNLTPQIIEYNTINFLLCRMNNGICCAHVLRSFVFLKGSRKLR